MKYLSRLIAFVILISFYSDDLNSQSRHFARYIHESDGLLSRDVLDIQESKDGRLWIGTSAGLQLYDGHHFFTLEDLTGVDPIGNQWVLNLTYDNGSKLYVFVYNNLFVVDTDTYECRLYDFPNHSNCELINFTLIGEDHYWAMLYDDHTKLFAKSNNEVKLIDSVQYQKRHGTNHLISLVDDFIIWSAGSFGIRIIDIKNDSLIRHHFDPDFGYPCLFETDGDIWSIRGLDLYKMEYPYVGEFKFVSEGPGFQYHSLASITKDEIWTVGSSIFRYKENEGYESFEWISENLDVNISNGIYRDSKGNNWFETKGGLVGVFEKEDAFNVLLNSNKPKVISEFRGILTHGQNEVIAFPEGKYGVLYRENIQSGKRDTLTIKDNKGKVIDYFYSALPPVYDSTYDAHWVMERDAGFGLFDAEELVFTSYLKDFNGKFTLLESGQILLGRRVDDLLLFNPVDRSSKKITVEFDSENEIGHINSIFEVDDSTIMICGIDGLFLVGLDGQIIKNFNTETQPRLPHNNVSMVRKDQVGNFWGGTKGGGVFCISNDFENIEYFSTEEGLPNVFVPTVLPIDSQYILAATFYGLSLIDVKSKKIINYFESNGISHNEFNTNSFLLNDDAIYLGTLNGINAISKKEVLLNLEEPELFLTKISVYNSARDSVRFYKNLDKGLEVDYKDTWFQVDFGITDLINPEYNIYKYRLKGYHERWQTLIGQGTLKFEGLPAGNYTLEIQGFNPSNVSCKNSLLMQVKVHQVFYKTIWFMLSALLLLGLIAYYWYDRIKNENRRLELTVAERTKQIIEDKEIIEQQSKELTSLDELKNEFFANISHELRTPLTLIMSPLQQIFKAEKIGPHERELLNLMHDNGKLLQDRIDEMLELSRLVASEVNLSYESVSLYNLIDFSTRIFKVKCADKNLLFNVEQINTNVYVLCDEKRLSKVIQNLVNNAIKFTSENGIIDCKFEYSDNQFLFSIEDDGIGIESSQVDKIFDRYYQIKQNYKTEKLGSGIGLSMVKEYIDLMNGDIQVLSKLNVGSSFKVFVPLQQSKDDDGNVIVYDVQPIGIDLQFSNGLKKPQLLLVEDNSDLRNFIASLLKQHFEVIQAEDGLEAVEKLDAFEIDIVLSDIMMPNMNGMQLLQKVRSDKQQKIIPFVFLTAKHNKNDILNAYKIGVDDYLTKPFLEEELFHRLNAVYQNYLSRVKSSQILNDIVYDHGVQEPASKFIAEFNALIVQNISSHDFTIDGIATKLGISRRHLIRLVKKEVGLTPSSYIKEIRLNMARNFKEQAKYKTVDEVSTAVGFTTTKYFEKLYFERFGTKWI